MNGLNSKVGEFLLEVIDQFRTLLDLNMPVVYFMYGLVFFVNGIWIIVQFQQSNSFAFGKELWLLGLFGLLHGISEWGYLFIPVQQAYLGPQVIYFFYALRTLIGAISFLVLFIFGLRVLFPRLGLWNEVISLSVIAIWLAIFGLDLSQGDVDSLLLSDTVASYLLALPSSSLTSLALYRQAKRVRDPQLSKDITRSVKALAFVFLAYAFFEGVVVSAEPFFPANIINTAWFYRLTDVPVQIFRAVCGLFVLIYTLKLLGSFNRETEHLLFQAKEDALRLAERERISRDLHDGVIQTIYVAELMIESCQHKLEPTSLAHDDLQESMKTLDKAMLELRSYLKGLKGETICQQPLQFVFKQVVEEFRKDYQIAIDFSFEANCELLLTTNRQNHLYHVLKELLHNVAKHSQANKVDIQVKENRRQLLIYCADNGVGIPRECLESGGCQGMGLSHIRKRMAILRGEITFEIPMSGGTLVTMVLPKEVKSEYDNSFVFGR